MSRPKGQEFPPKVVEKNSRLRALNQIYFKSKPMEAEYSICRVCCKCTPDRSSAIGCLCAAIIFVTSGLAFLLLFASLEDRSVA